MMRTSTVAVVLLIMASTAAGQSASPSKRALLRANVGSIPIHFIENKGIHPNEVRFYVQGKDKTVFFARDGITFRLRGAERDWAVKLIFIGANPGVTLRGEERREAVFSYFRGPMPRWKTGCPSFGRVVYEDLWPGVDLVYRARLGQLKYDFIVKPGASPRLIQLRYDGASALRILQGGALQVETPVQVLEDEAPTAYQRQDGERVPVDVSYAISKGEESGVQTVRFRIGRFDRSEPLVIDPAVFVYSGYLGGAGDEDIRAVAVDAAGNAYVGGLDLSATASFPRKVGPNLKHSLGTGDGFVAKIDPSGTRLLYCGYIGGAMGEWVQGIAVDSSGCAYVTGATRSDQGSFPVRAGPDLSYNSPRGSAHQDCFVAKVAADGRSLVYCGYIGGWSTDIGRAIAVDKAGCAYVGGATGSRDLTLISSPVEIPFPTTVGPDLTFNGLSVGGGTGLADGFVAKVASDGRSLVYCGYVGGQSNEAVEGIAVDAQGSAYITGWTSSPQTSFPVRVGPSLQISHTATTKYKDAFVAKVNTSGKSLDYCGYIGGTHIEFASAIVVDAKGAAYVTGDTSGPSSMPLKVGPQLSANARIECFVAKVSANGGSLDYCGLITSSWDDFGTAIGVDALGNAYVGGVSHKLGTGFPVTKGPSPSAAGSWEGFIARVDRSGKHFDYCGYVGGVASEHVGGVAVTPSGNAIVVGATGSSQQSFPVAVGPDLSFNGGVNDGFIAKVAFTDLVASGAPRIGGTVDLTLTATDSAGLTYQAGSSLGTGPIPIDVRKLGLSLDWLLVATVRDYWPHIFAKYRGVIGPDGEAKARINIPNYTSLIGLRIHSAFVTLDPKAPSGIRDISPTVTITITK